MKYNIIIIAVLFCTVFLHPQSDKFFSTRGKNIIDRDGNPILLKGINLGNWLVPEGYMFKFGDANSPKLVNEVITQLIGPDESKKFWETFRNNYITEEDIHFIKSSGFNSVRVPFNFRLFVMEENHDITISTGFEMLDRVIKWCKKENLYIILDMHCAPGGQTGDNIDDSWGYPFLFENEGSRQLTINLWKNIADRYKKESIIIGYDLLNEPIAHYFDSTKLNPLLEPFYKEVVSEIRKVDKNHICILGGAQWDSNFSIFNKPFDSKLVYTFHKYWTEPTKEVIQSYIDFSDKYNVPIWMGESGENTDDWISSFRQVLEENNIGWCFWPFKKLDSTRDIASIKLTDEYKVVSEYANSDRSNYEKIRHNRPDPDKIKQALSDYLENCKLKNCSINDGYLKALGLK